MESISEYSGGTSKAELYHFLARSIIEKGIQDFSGLLAHAGNIPINAKTEEVFEGLFTLIRKLYWGFFRDIDPVSYPKVWKEIVLPHPLFPACGDLKKNLTISNIFVGVLDLHGYTGFCDKHKNNLSMLKSLDELIQIEMTKLARARDVILQRRHGDEMILVGTRAADIIELTLNIIDVFAGKKGAVSEQNIQLPDMHISAGIAGGNKFTPFIITLDGDLSGGVVNTASRLQSRANQLSKDRSRIIVGRTVHASYITETRSGRSSCRDSLPVRFVDSGFISFRGIDVAVSEVIFHDKDEYRTLVEKDLTALMKSISNGSWREGLFINLLLLMIRLYKLMPAFRIANPYKEPEPTLDNESFIRMAQDVFNSFKVKQLYFDAYTGLERLVALSKLIPDFDRLTLEYADRIIERYKSIVSDFSARIEVRTRELAETVLPGKYRQLFEESRKAALIQKQLSLEIRKKMAPNEVAQIWRSSVYACDDGSGLTIHSGKV
jgi:class 3 adenylate cyclase